MTSIEIAVTCTWFQRRLCWMMSSVLQQDGDVPRIVFSVSYPANNGNPTTEEVCRFFRGKGLTVKEQAYSDMQVIQYRGLARNRQVGEADCDWILFADCDMVYDRRFFADLGRQLEGPLRDETKILSARRVSLDKQFSKDFFNKVDQHTYPCMVCSPDDIVSKWPIFQMSANVGAGYFQLVNTRRLREDHGGVYVDPSDNRDWGWIDGKKMQKANSDKQFRHMMGGVTKIQTMPQYHLNHERDNEEGYHLTLQR